MARQSTTAKFEATNSEHWVARFTVEAENPSGVVEAVDISDLVITLVIREEKTDGAIATLTLDDGLEFVTDGTDGDFTALADLRDIDPGLYRVGCTLALSDESLIRQFFFGTMNVNDGVV